MMKFEEIRDYLNKKDIPYWESEDGQKLILRACIFDSQKHTNFFDYHEPYKVPHCWTKDKVLKELFNDPRIIIEDCSDCCGCGGW